MPREATALVPLVDGFEETEAVAVIDVLRRAGVHVTTAGVGTKTPTGSHDMTVTADALLADVLGDKWDAIVLPGGPGTKELNKVEGLHDRLREQAKSGKLVAAICAAPTILAAAGLLDGVPATCFPGARDDMAGAQLHEQSVVEHENIITSQAVGTAIEFGLHIAGRLVGEDIAINVARSICYPPRSRFTGTH